MTDTQNELEQGTFDLDAFVQGRGFPTDTVTVFTNDDAAHKLAKVNARLTEIAQNPAHTKKPLKDEFALLETQASELKDAIRASALTFHLRGISPGHIKKITKDVVKDQAKEDNAWDEGEAEDILNFRWLTPHIIKVVNASGDADERVFTEERVENLANLLPTSEWKKLTEAVSDLSFKSVVFDAAVDAGFLPKS